MKSAFPLGARLATSQGFTGRVETVFISAEAAYSAQIAHRRVRLAVKLDPPAVAPHLWLRVRIGKPFPRPLFHYFLVAPGGRSGAMIAERDAVRLPSRAAVASPRFELGDIIVDPYGFVAMITSIHRQLASAIQSGVIAPGWFELQEQRPSSKRQPFYGCTGDRGFGGVLIGEAEVRLAGRPD